MANPTFREAERKQLSFLAAIEKKTLIWLAERMPAWVNSDHLTLLGFAAMFAAGLFYWAAGRDRRALILVIVALAVNWFGVVIRVLGLSVNSTDPSWHVGFSDVL